jgi:hypothetical protein
MKKGDYSQPQLATPRANYFQLVGLYNFEVSFFSPNLHASWVANPLLLLPMGNITTRYLQITDFS